MLNNNTLLTTFGLSSSGQATSRPLQFNITSSTNISYLSQYVAPASAVTETPTSSKDGGISSGAIAGIVVAIVVAVSILFSSSNFIANILKLYFSKLTRLLLLLLLHSFVFVRRKMQRRSKNEMTVKKLNKNFVQPIIAKSPLKLIGMRSKNNTLRFLNLNTLALFINIPSL